MKRYSLRILFITLLVFNPFLSIFSSTAGNTIHGKVFCEGNPLSRIIVTDGYDCVLTNAKGEYQLQADKNARFIYLTVPSGYKSQRKGTIPVFYHRIDKASAKPYDFYLEKNPVGDIDHTFIVQADVQVTSLDDINRYKSYLKDIVAYNKMIPSGQDVFGLDCGDIVGDTPSLYPDYIRAVSTLNIPVYRAIGNHDMTYGGRTFEHSYSTFEDYFGPVYYSFNKGKAHYIVLDNCFYVNRNYQYIGYIDERTFSWMEKDLSFVPRGSLVFVLMHIPSSSTKELVYNALLQDETSNAAGLYEMLKGYNAHIITGHSHFNLNVCFNDSLMEHNTAAVCGTWWKADLCVDGTLNGYGVYQVSGDEVKWKYKSVGHPADYQFRLYPVGTSDEYPGDVIANVWNWDENWKVEWYENGSRIGEMERYTGYDPEAKAICSDKKKVVYDWISPVKTGHLFHATPKNPMAKIEVRVTDRFGNIYRSYLKNK